MARRAGGRRLPLLGLEEMRKETVGHEAEYVPNGFVTDGCPVDSHCLSKLEAHGWAGGLLYTQCRCIVLLYTQCRCIVLRSSKD